MGVKPLIIFLCLLFAVSVSAGENLLKNGDFSQGMKSWNAFNCYPHTIEGNKFIVNMSKEGKNKLFLLQQRIILEADKTYRLSYNIELEQDGTMRQIYQMSKDPWRALGIAKNMELKSGKHSISLLFKAHETSGNNPPVFTFNLTMLHGKVAISDIKLEKISKLPISVLNKEWKAFLNVKPPHDFVSIPKTIDSQNQVIIDAEKHGGKLNLGKMYGYKSNHSTAVLYNEFESDKTGNMSLSISADWWVKIYSNGSLVFDGNGNSNIVDFLVEKGKNLLAVVVKAGSRGWAFNFSKPGEMIRFNAGNEWQPVNINTYIKPNSALDLSYMVDKPAGKYGRLIVNSKGRLVFKAKPDEEVRMLGFNGAPYGLFEIKDDKEFKEKAKLFVHMATQMGYSLFRVHSALDRYLMHESKEEMQINLKYLDRWDYLISEMKKEGIYIHAVIFSFGLYFENYRKTHDLRDRHKLMMFADEADITRKHFEYATKTLLNHVNPYTKMAWKDDPTIAFVEFYNEQYSGIYRAADTVAKNPQLRPVIEQKWREWLVEKYKHKTISNELKAELNGKPLSQAPLTFYNLWGGEKSSLRNEYLIFWKDKVNAQAKWCTDLVHREGYKGLTISSDFGLPSIDWQESPVVDGHAYYCHPSDWLNPGSKVDQKSSIEDIAGYWRRANSKQLANRPMIVGEYNHCLWNPYRYEGGMVFGGYSALQGYGALMVHSHPVHFRTKNAIVGNFSVGSSPVVRASQFITAHIFQRKDVKSSKKKVVLRIPKQFYEEDGNSARSASSDQNKIGLLTNFSLSFPWLPSAVNSKGLKKADLSIIPTGASEESWQGWAASTIDLGGKSTLASTVKEMRKRNILSKANITDVDKGIFQSDTEELTLEVKRKLLKIVTAKTEGVCILANDREKMDNLEVVKSSVDGMIAVCSVDNKPIKNSRRMVLLYSTEEANSGMELFPGGATLKYIGKAPILLRLGKLEMTLKNNFSSKLSLYALGYNGERREKIPMTLSGGKLSIKIDTSKLKDGPTTFFELVAE